MVLLLSTTYPDGIYTETRGDTPSFEVISGGGQLWQTKWLPEIVASIG